MSTELLSHIAQRTAQASWAAALPAVILLALGEWRAFPVRWRWFLSIVVALRLVLPAVPGIAWHPLGWLKAASPLPAGAAAMDSVAAASVPSSPWPWLWLVGFVLVLGWLGLSQMLLWRRIAASGYEANNALQDLMASCVRQTGLCSAIALRVVPGLTTPAVFGLHRPSLLLPEDAEATHTYPELRGMMLHELQHIRSRDSLWTWLGLLLCALHWFNPLVWLCLGRFRADRELMCDARTLAMLSPRQRTSYGQALLKTWESVGCRQPALLTPFLRRSSTTYTRILMSLHPIPKTRFLNCLAILLVPALSLFSLTTARADREPVKTEEATKDGEAPKKGAKNKHPRNRREGDGAKTGTRDGDKPKEGSRDGGGAKKKTGPRDGDGAPKKGPRDGDKPKDGPRDGDPK